jgi:hypothetical protein
VTPILSGGGDCIANGGAPGDRMQMSAVAMIVSRAALLRA